MKKEFALALLLVLFAANSCLAQQFQEKAIGHVYYVSLPDYMVKATDLNEVASLQYQNTAKETYVIVIEDNKAELEAAGMGFAGALDFYNSFANDFLADAKVEEKVKEVQISGAKAVQSSALKKFDNMKVFYLVTVIETPTHYYKMLAWTMEQYRKDYEADFKKIAASFHE